MSLIIYTNKQKLSLSFHPSLFIISFIQPSCSQQSRVSPSQRGDKSVVTARLKTVCDRRSEDEEVVAVRGEKMWVWEGAEALTERHLEISSFGEKSTEINVHGLPPPHMETNIHSLQLCSRDSSSICGADAPIDRSIDRPDLLHSDDTQEAKTKRRSDTGDDTCQWTDSFFPPFPPNTYTHTHTHYLSHKYTHTHTYRVIEDSQHHGPIRSRSL